MGILKYIPAQAYVSLWCQIQYIGEKVKQGVQYIGKICYKAFSFVRNEFNNRTNNLETYQIPLKDIPKSVLDKTAKLSSEKILFKLGKLIESLPGRAIDQKRLLKLGIDPDHINIDPELERWKQKATELLDAKVKEEQAPLKAEEAAEREIAAGLEERKKLFNLVSRQLNGEQLSKSEINVLDKLQRLRPRSYDSLVQSVKSSDITINTGMSMAAGG